MMDALGDGWPRHPQLQPTQDSWNCHCQLPRNYPQSYQELSFWTTGIIFRNLGIIHLRGSYDCFEWLLRNLYPFIHYMSKCCPCYWQFVKPSRRKSVLTLTTSKVPSLFYGSHSMESVVSGQQESSPPGPVNNWWGQHQ